MSHATFFKSSMVPRAIARTERKRARKTIERTVKAEIKRLDGRKCRWPHCEYKRIAQPLDAAHLDAAGMGGDPKSVRMTAENLIAICRLHHRTATRSMHSGDLKVHPLTAQGTRGPCEFWNGDTFAGREIRVGVLEKAS